MSPFEATRPRRAPAPGGVWSERGPITGSRPPLQSWDPVAGGLAGYYIGAALFEVVAKPLLDLYGYGDAFGEFQAMYTEYGAWAVFVAGVTPFPYKVLTIPRGAVGLSLGGYTAALLASLDEELACVIAGIPLADFTRALFRHGPMLHIAEATRSGVEEGPVRRLTSVVSPLDLTPLVPPERRYIFGATGDRLVPPDQVRDLYEHWDRPAMVWYAGGHLTFRAHADVRRLVRRGLRESGLAA